MGADYRTKYFRTVLGGAEVLTNPQSSAANQWFGLAALTSVAAGLTATVSTTLVQSNSLILYGLQATNSMQNLPAAYATAVTTISPQGFFTFGTASFAYTGSYQATVAWMILNPVRNW